jgi:hypothetical protein
MFDVVLATIGIALVVIVWMSVLRTTLIPRRSSSRIARWTLRACSTASAALARRLPNRLGTWVMDVCGSVSLFAIAMGWMIGLAVGFGMLVIAFGDTKPGASFVIEMNNDAVAIVVAAAASAVLVAATFAAYLNRFMDAYDRRERMIAQLVAQVQRVADADTLVATYLRSGSRESLDNYFAQWAGWLADVHLSHVNFPGLIHHRSAGKLTWPNAAVAVMDAAALVEAVAPHWAPLHARVLLDVGSSCLQGLAKHLGIVLPPVTVSLQGREERGFCDTMQLAVNSGLPAERNIDHASAAFQKIRVRYAPYAGLIESRLLSL